MVANSFLPQVTCWEGKENYELRIGRSGCEMKMVSPSSVPGGIKSDGCRVLDHVRSWILAFPFPPPQNTPRWQLLAAPQGNSYR